MLRDTSELRELLFSFRGRIAHRTYVTLCLAARLLTIVLLFVSVVPLFGAINRAGDVQSTSIWIVLTALVCVMFVILLIWISWATLVKRLHDRSWSGWWSILVLVPIASLWVLLETMFFRKKTRSEQIWRCD